MTIEAKLEALTTAINGLTAAVQSARPSLPPVHGADPAAIASAQKALKEAIKVAPVVEVKALTYDDVKVPFLALVKKNRDLALATLKPFGLDSLKPAKPEQFQAILAALNNALAS